MSAFTQQKFPIKDTTSFVSAVTHYPLISSQNAKAYYLQTTEANQVSLTDFCPYFTTCRAMKHKMKFVDVKAEVLHLIEREDG